MRIVPNPVKERLNRRRHGLDFSLAAEILSNPYTDEPDDRPLGYEHEGRRLVTGRVGMRVFVLVFEPVLAGGELMAEPISLRKAEEHEARDYWSTYG